MKEGPSFNPIHVFEADKVNPGFSIPISLFSPSGSELNNITPLDEFRILAMQDDTSSFDWRDLIFSQGSFPDFNPGQESASITSERPVNSLQFDDFTICYPRTSSTSPDNMSLNHCPCELIEVSYFSHFYVYFLLVGNGQL